MNEESKYQAQTQEGSINIEELFQFILTQWKKILFGSALIGLVSVIYSLLLTNEYTATIFLTEVKQVMKNLNKL